MWGRNAINSDVTMQGYEQQDPNKAIKNLKDVLSALKYHQIPAVSTILVDQANRVGNMFQTMETELANRPGYQALGLQAAWNTWIKGRADLARTKAETYLTDYIQKLNDGYGSDYQRQPQYADTVLLGKIDALTAAIAGRTAWANPFP